MSKTRHAKRVMPRNGRMENGYFKSDYDQGFDDAQSDGRRVFDLTPLCLTARSRDYWLGFRAAKIRMGEAHKLDSVKAVHSERVREYRALRHLAEKQGFNVDAYLKAGGKLKDACDLVLGRNHQPTTNRGRKGKRLDHSGVTAAA